MTSDESKKLASERRQQIKQLLHEVLERGPDQRSSYLAGVCASDPSLRLEVESLLASSEEAETFIEKPALETKIDLPPNHRTDLMAGRRVGSYQVIREIGQGGMGTVYLASRADDQYQQQVAIKLVKRGMDTDFILRRFRNERQILASLDHPNIARLLDGGVTEDGLPYFVMEYVEGRPINEYCDVHSLPIAERLRLFRTVCSAVQYAHQNLIVHRDIKPTNILITTEGVPKLLDFGIAKILTPDHSDETMLTLTAQRVMTPGYASPEQFRGETVTTATDVYLLGLLLYELLTGHHPYRFKSQRLEEVGKVICKEDPPRPSTAVTRIKEVDRTNGAAQVILTPELVSQTRESTPEKLRRRLAGDLDNIVMKSISKEPQRRYSSAEQFSEDIRRHLENLPVIARKDSLGYRSKKFMLRHKASVSAAAMIVLTLIAGILATAWQARVARVERARAERRFNDVRKLANSFMFQLHDAIENLPGSTRVRELLVKQSLEYLNSLAQEAGDEPSLQRELAKSYQKVGDVQGYPFGANLGDVAGALESYRKSLVICESLVAVDRTNADLRRDLLVNYERIGDTLMASGDAAGALKNHRKALTLSESLSAADPANKRLRRTLLVSYIKVGEALAVTGDTGSALDIYRKALKSAEALFAADPTSAVAGRDLTVSYNKVGDSLAAIGNTREGLESYRTSLTIRERVAAADPTNANARRDVASNYEKIANVLLTNGDKSGALDYQRKAMVIDESLAAADPANTDAQFDLAISQSNLGEILATNGHTADALQSFRKGLVILETLSAANPANTEIRYQIADSYSKIGHLQATDGNTVGAMQNYHKGLTIFEALSTNDRTNAELHHALADTYAKLAEAHAILAANTRTSANKRLGQWREARSWYEKSLKLLSDMRNRGSLTGSDTGKPEEISREIAKCDDALARLGSRISAGDRQQW